MSRKSKPTPSLKAGPIIHLPTDKKHEDVTLADLKKLNKDVPEAELRRARKALRTQDREKPDLPAPRVASRKPFVRKSPERDRLLTDYRKSLASFFGAGDIVRDRLSDWGYTDIRQMPNERLKVLVAMIDMAKAEREAKDRNPIGEIFPGTKLSMIPADATQEQIGGNHYKQFELQPAEICHRNKLTFLEGSVVKRMHRHSRGGKGIQDLKKAIHEIRLIAKFDYNEDI